MSLSNTTSLVSLLAVLLASAGCVVDAIDATPGVVIAAEGYAVEPLGHELYRMLDDAKAAAAVAELPPQF